MGREVLLVYLEGLESRDRLGSYITGGPGQVKLADTWQPLRRLLIPLLTFYANTRLSAMGRKH